MRDAQVKAEFLLQLVFDLDQKNPSYSSFGPKQATELQWV